jgi:hypothetical protein
MLFRVSEVEQFRWWRQDEDADLDVLLGRLRGQEPPSEQMLAGTAFHKALEHAQFEEASELEADGRRFLIECDIKIALPNIRELRASKTYGDVVVTGQVDAIHALRIEDHKTTARFDADRYFEGYQWRYYLDIFSARVFRWNVFEMRPVDDRVYSVFGFHQIEQHAYSGMHEDCLRLARDLGEFAALHLPERKQAA